MNLTGAFLGARAAARVMGEGGRLIFTGSVLGERPGKGLAAYSASKAGLVGLAKGLALDLAPAGITVNVVAPGWFDSPLAHAWTSNDHLSEVVMEHTASQALGPFRRPGRRLPVPRLGCGRLRHRDRAQRGRGIPSRMSADGLEDPRSMMRPDMNWFSVLEHHAHPHTGQTLCSLRG